jgi:hypothetical protein
VCEQSSERIAASDWSGARLVPQARIQLFEMREVEDFVGHLCQSEIAEVEEARSGLALLRDQASRLFQAIHRWLPRE